MQAILISIDYKEITDIHPDYSFLEQDCYNDRLEQFENGDFYFISISAEATIHIPFEMVNYKGEKETGYKIETISSGGLWGIESDSSSEYLESIYEEEKESLIGYLKTPNVDLSNCE